MQFLAISRDCMTRWDFDARHPEATLGTLFLPVWYEGRQQPEHAWQSTGASDASEAKLGLMPLVFGTLKATFYTMLFGAPLALLAAIYSSEFLHPRTEGTRQTHDRDDGQPAQRCAGLLRRAW